MKKYFSAYYPISEEEIKAIWKNCIFVLDSNILLDLYRYTEDTRDELIEILEDLGDRLWIPNHVGYEFMRNRIDVIQEQTGMYLKTKKYIEKLGEQI